ncbi:unnamed protein product, partial [Heligmosomoides polygyrus]|uniref:PPP1R35_C domain-containing protein n=1 Tax=Heligmosomoides polygyrus TaxID=6339 RepID=A0A183F9W8_HELPZ
VEEKAKYLGRKRKVSSPSQKENQFNAAVISRGSLNNNSIADDQNQLESLLVTDKELQLPEVRMVGHLTALRCQPRLSDERVDAEIYAKRHEKLEKEEKQILRRCDFNA